MQTTPNTNHATLACVPMAGPQEDASSPIEMHQIVSRLLQEAQELRGRADILEAHAQELDNGDHESSLQAAKLRAKRSEDLALADEIRHVAQVVSSTPHSKKHRHTLYILQAHIVNALVESDAEVETAEITQTTAHDHKENLRHHNTEKAVKEKASEQKKAETNSKKKAAPAKKKTAKAAVKPPPAPPPTVVNRTAPPLWGAMVPQSTSISYVAAQAMPYNTQFPTLTQVTDAPPMTGMLSHTVREAARTVVIPQGVGPIHTCHPAMALIPSTLGLPVTILPLFTAWPRIS